MGPAIARGRVALAVAITAVVFAVAVYVVTTTDDEQGVDLAIAPGAFNDDARLDPSIDRAHFSPNGQRLLGIGDDGIGLARRGRLELITEPGAAVADAAWMPDSESVLVAGGPGVISRLDVVTLDGAVEGVAKLDAPFSVGLGRGMAVDRRGARAVVTTETRDTIGGQRRFDLVLVDLPTGRVTPLTDTAADEAWPVFVDDNRVAFTRAEAVVVRDLASTEETELSRLGEGGATCGVLVNGAVVYTTSGADGVVIWAHVPGGKRTRVGGQPRDTVVWTVDPTGSTAVVTGQTTTPAGQRVGQLRAITLTPPGPD